MTRNGWKNWKWQEIAGNCWNFLKWLDMYEMNGNGWKWWKWLKIVRNGWK